MLKLTKRTEYGLIALVHLADKAAEAPAGSEVEVVSARAIGDQFPVPKRLLAEALKALQADGIVESTRGAQGGYRLAKQASEISLRDVVGALEGNPMLTTCDGPANGEEHSCEMESVCRIKSPLARVRMGIWALLDGVTLESIASRSIDPAEFVSPTH